MYFNPEDEVDDFEYRLSKDLERIYKEKGITMYGTSRENHYEIIFDKEDDVDNEESEEVKE